MRKFLDLESAALFLDDDPFYHKRLSLFSITISVTTAMKVKSIVHVKQSIINETQQLNIQSSGLKLITFFYLISK